MNGPLTVDILPRLASVRPEEWAELFATHPDRFELVRLIESSGMDGFSFSSVVVRQAGRPILLVPVFTTVFHLASMNFLDEWDEDARAMVRWGRGLGCRAGSGSRACLMRVQWQWYGAGVLGV